MQLKERITNTSIKHFGFMVQRPSRMREYSWILEEMNREPGDACDIGAGTSPVPIILAEDGWVVDTVDYWKEETADEWGFVNYGKINSNLRSYNMDFAGYDHGPCDTIYSISAIEHMPAATRRKVFQNAYDNLYDNGIFLATIDVSKGTDFIHNRSYGKQIEDDHGTVQDVIVELEIFNAILWWREGFKGQGQDVLFIKCVK